MRRLLNHFSVVRLAKYLPGPGYRALNSAIGRRRPAGQVSVAMFHFGRCGSTAVASLLRRHPSIAWDGEVFELLREDVLSEARLTRSPLELIQIRRNWTRTPVYGFETKTLAEAQLRPGLVGLSLEEYVDGLRGLGFDHFIILKRRHYLRQIVSAHVGWKTRTWHQPRDAAASLTPVEIDPAATRYGTQHFDLLSLFRYFDQAYEHHRRVLRGAAVATLELMYEDDILPGPEIAYATICQFLDLPVHPGRAWTSRTNPFPLNAMVENYEEIARLLQASEFAWMVEEELE